jgi:hypothetical protein
MISGCGWETGWGAIRITADVVSLALRRVEDDVSGLNAEAVIRIWRCIRGGRQEDKDLEVRAEAV